MGSEIGLSKNNTHRCCHCSSLYWLIFIWGKWGKCCLLGQTRVWLCLVEVEPDETRVGLCLVEVEQDILGQPKKAAATHLSTN